ncbi:MAG TPA: sulfotransferase [Rubrobacteraceae bacterium]|nr:sulfotransferase [Rubrobacteraceae bacterium]
MSGVRPSRVLGALHADLGRGDHRSSVFLAGSGRSGTTWISGVINHQGAYRLVFEPFHPGRVRIMQHFRRKQYLRPGDRREEYLGPARAALTGELRSLWTDRFNERLLARQRLIKEIRANLLLGWIHANFPGMPMVLLLRHPCAVVASRLALGWGDVLTETMEQEELVEDFLLPVETEIRAARDPFERHLFSWCIENYVPLRQFGPGEIHLAFYEEFLVRPERELRRLFSFLGEDFDARSAYRALERPSPLSRNPGAQPVGGWRRSVNGRQLGRAVEILGLFDLDRLYGEGTMPDPSGALMGPARR